MRTMCAVVMCVVSLASCSQDSPTAPTPGAPPVSQLPPASSVVGISIIGDMWISATSTPIQQTARLITSNVPFEWVDGSNGVTWSIEPSAVATIDQRGRVTPVASGAAVVTARFGDKTGTNSIRVLPDYSGQWAGEFVVTSCSGGFDFRECGRIMFGTGGGGGSRVPYAFALTLAQDRDQVTGTLRETFSGERVAPVTGLVRVNGVLVLEASVPQAGNEPFRVFNWSSSANTAVTAMTGAFTQIDPRSTTFGDKYVVRTEQEFANVARFR